MPTIADEFTLPRADDARLRRLADREGYAVRKSRWRHGSIDNFGGYMIVDPDTNTPCAGFRYDLTGQDVAEWLSN